MEVRCRWSYVMADTIMLWKLSREGLLIVHSQNCEKSVGGDSVVFCSSLDLDGRIKFLCGDTILGKIIERQK